MEGHEKLGQKMFSFSCVPLILRSPGHFERCALAYVYFLNYFSMDL